MNVVTYYCSSTKSCSCTQTRVRTQEHTNTTHHELLKGVLYQTAEELIGERHVTTLQR